MSVRPILLISEWPDRSQLTLFLGNEIRGMQMNLDPTRMTHWQIAEAAEENMKPIRWIAEEMGPAERRINPKGSHISQS